uniref:Predicted protein n=1 Tax=Hordeum vulgare subsp. vulgare TaxID=112509 RepID=F2CPN5_HORVV|nr:predicted protein [Hordeum vulgare subsp. vulgare]
MYFVYLGPTSDKPQASCFFFSYVQTLGLTAGDRSIYSLLLQATTTRDLISACSLIFGPAGCCIQTSTSQISVLLTPHWVCPGRKINALHGNQDTKHGGDWGSRSR